MRIRASRWTPVNSSSTLVRFAPLAVTDRAARAPRSLLGPFSHIYLEYPFEILEKGCGGIRRSRYVQPVTPRSFVGRLARINFSSRVSPGAFRSSSTVPSLAIPRVPSVCRCSPHIPTPRRNASKIRRRLDRDRCNSRCCGRTLRVVVSPDDFYPVSNCRATRTSRHCRRASSIPLSISRSRRKIVISTV